MIIMTVSSSARTVSIHPEKISKEHIKMKKILSIVMAAVLATGLFCLTGCGGNDDMTSTSSPSSSSRPPAVSSSEETNVSDSSESSLPFESESSLTDESETDDSSSLSNAE